MPGNEFPSRKQVFLTIINLCILKGFFMVSHFHFYVVFNPLINPVNDYPTQAHEFYHLLKQNMSHLWWGKMKKTMSLDPLNIGNFFEVVEQNKIFGSETILFISDFTHLWIAKVEEVSTDRPPKEETLSVYDSEEVEIWFKITDMDLLCVDQNSTKSKIAELGIKNHFYPGIEIKSLTPTTGAVRFPLIVEDRSTEHYFSKYKNKKRIVADNPLVSKSMEGWEDRERITYTIPLKNFKKLPALIQKQVMWAEGVFAQDVNKTATSYLRILESIINVTLMREIHARVKGYGDYIPLGEIYNILNTTKYNGSNVDELLKNSVHSSFWEFCKNDLRNFLHMPINGKKLCFLNPGEAMKPEAALFIRNSMLGVGCKGIINEIIERYEEIAKLTVAEDVEKAGQEPKIA
jgi:hypothetical protein